jgi:alpha-tubulin suppressor-like RCC1 family protein
VTKLCCSAVAIVLLGVALLAPTPAAADGNEAPGAPPAFRELSLGYDHSCAIDADQALRCWGNNFYGQLGLGNTTNRGWDPGQLGTALPTVDVGTDVLTGRLRVEAVSGGQEHTCALLAIGRVKCWGDNSFGQLGLGDMDDRGDQAGEMGNALPVTNLDVAPVVAISTGAYHSCALSDDGTVRCWGANYDGQLGRGNVAQRGDLPDQMGANLAPVDLGTGRTATAISAGANHTCALLDDSTVKCWGANNAGQLGRGDLADVGDGVAEMGDDLSAVPLGNGAVVTAISAGGDHTCALLDTGQVKCWGENASGELGLGNVDDRGDGPAEMGSALPTVDLGGGFVTGLATGSENTCAVLDAVSVKCWGGNGAGQLGLGDTSDRGNSPGEMGTNLPAVSLGTGRTVDAVSLGNAHVCARLDNDQVRCWGYNASGQLGLGDDDDRGDQAGELGDALPAVDLPPSNDDVADAALVTGLGGTVHGSNANATLEPSENPVIVGASTTVWFRWTPAFGGRTTMTTIGSFFDTVLGVYTGSPGSLTPLVGNDDIQPGVIRQSKVRFQAHAGTPYTIVVAGFGGASGRIALNVNVPLPCDSRAVTVDLVQGDAPTAGNDVIMGTAANDTINGLGGNDRICGIGGADTIRGGPGNDRLYGSLGADVIRGGAGIDLLDGGGGADRLYGEAGADTLRGGTQRDTCAGGTQRDTQTGCEVRAGIP